MIMNKKRKGPATAEEVAMAACRSIVLSMLGEGGQHEAKRAVVLARFALAMKS
jgi:hypothetical protein